MFVLTLLRFKDDQLLSSRILDAFPTRLEAVRVAVRGEVLRNLKCACREEHLVAYRNLIRESEEVTEETLDEFEDRWNTALAWFQEAESGLLCMIEVTGVGFAPGLWLVDEEKPECVDHPIREVDHEYYRRELEREGD